MISPETDFLSAAYEIQNMQNRIYMHSNYDPAFIVDEMKKDIIHRSIPVMKAAI